MSEADTQQLHEIAISVARMEGKLDGALAQGADHETRIRGLERAMWKAAGAGATAGGAVAAVVVRFFGG